MCLRYIRGEEKRQRQGYVREEKVCVSYPSPLDLLVCPCLFGVSGVFGLKHPAVDLVEEISFDDKGIFDAAR